MHRHRLHPRVVRVARVVDVAAVHDLSAAASRKELVEQPCHLGALRLARQIEHFLRKLAPHRRRDDLARIHHAARQGDDAVIRADDGGDLQPAARRVEACDDRVGGVVGAPLAEVAALAHPRPAARVEGLLMAVKGDRAFVRRAARPVDARRIHGVCPAAWLHRAVVCEHVRRRERRWRVVGPLHRPRHLLVGHDGPCGVEWEGRAGLRVRPRP
mmetsp:Transcript_44114/g.142280  ORF Transcript_44114/g.142280 Transcript_44114/m.142280 type:complete len:214 (-) Transcript_44114:618-1259(-)